jgi:anti-sigma B factor antagonist
MALAYKLPEELDAATMVRLKPEFEKLAQAQSDVVLEMDDVAFLDSSGIGGIVYLYKRLVAAGYRLTVTGATHQALDLLTHLRLADLLVEHEE